MNVLSLFDGMSCGMIAMKNAGVQVDRYVAYEIDKYAIKVSTHNFPEIEQKGDVFAADFTEYEGFDWLIGGSPCTYWSIAQKNNRETEASGLGWELFSQYVRALREAKPKYFIYENNKSMAKAIRDSIRETFGFEEICINSALVSAQNRQRYYWVGKRNEDGTYSKVDVQQPEDRGILLRDVLDGLQRIPEYSSEKSRPVDAHFANLESGTWYKRVFNPNPAKQQHDYVAEPLPASSVLNLNPSGNGINGSVSRIDTKSRCLTTNKGEGQKIIVPVNEPCCVAERGRYNSDGNINQHYEVREDGKTNVLTTVSKDNQIAEPCCMRYERTEEAKRVRKDYEAGLVHHGFHELSELHPRTDGKSNTLSTVLKDNPICEPVGEQILCPCNDEDMRVREATKKGYLDVKQGDCVDMTQPNSKTRRGRDMSEKCNCLTTSPQYYQYVGTLQYATPCEWDSNGIPTKAISGADGKTYTVYCVADGQITIKGKTYPIKLIDGYYIIRKLTVSECKRLQTVPEWYDFSVISNSQAYKCLGNGWTVDVIAHIFGGLK